MGPKTNVIMVVAGLLAAMFIGALDATVVATATPHIITDLHGQNLFSWVFAVYTLTTCVATPIFGKLADLFGRKAVFAVGIGLFVLGSILCGAAQSMPELIWFRALQGFGAGALAPVCFTIIGDLFSGKQRGKMMGIFSSVWSVAGLLGPLIGGISSIRCHGAGYSTSTCRSVPRPCCLSSYFCTNRSNAGRKRSITSER